MEINLMRRHSLYLMILVLFSASAELRAALPAEGATINYELAKWGPYNFAAHLELSRVSEHVLLARPALTKGNSDIPIAGSLYSVGMTKFLPDPVVRSQVLSIIDREVSASGLPLLSISEGPGSDAYIVCVGKLVVSTTLSRPVPINPDGYKFPEKP